MLDRPQAVREGEELNVEALTAFLAESLPRIGESPPAGELEVEQFPSGFSNLTYLLRWEGREAVLRRPPFGSEVRSAHDMGREFRVLSALDGVWPKAPRPLVHCDDEAVLGAPFYLMERVEGVILRSGMPAAAVPPPHELARIGAALVETLAELHALDWKAAGLGDLGRPEGYAGRQVEGWSRRWQAARTDEVPEMERVAAWLEDNLPRRPAAALIHNDFKYDNLVLDPSDRSRVLAVLDWEMATIGDPWLDLGTALGYWAEPDDPPALRALALSPTTLPGNPTRAEVAELYARAAERARGSGSEAGAEPIPSAAIVACWVYGLFKIAVVIQQIHARYRAGLTSDPRFAGLLQGVRACAVTAAQAIDKGRLDRLYEA